MDMTPAMHRDALAAATLRDPRWLDVQAHNASADGRFWFGVATTGVFCRPGCGARTPRPENVRFFTSIDAAKSAGFRACKRCRPEGLSDAQANRVLVEAACQRIDAAEREPTLAELSADADMSPFHFQRMFKAVLGISPKQYATTRRQQRVRDGLNGGRDVTTALHDAGFGSASRFHAEAKSQLGMTAQRYRDGGVGERIRYALGDSSLGRVLIAETDRGLCTILFGDDDDELVADLHARFARAECISDDAALATHLADVIALVDDPAHAVDLPLDIRGTAFQQKVWAELRRIPAGETVSYSELATRVGVPDAARAIAGACAANPLAVAIPCHRVVRADGALSGYRWGVQRKEILLQREGARSPRD
ncbi:bifunctional DNA-binding transcriptional regulator/O6-methylguanine-DNA methyltransferase Ada [Solilutibacter silvestris]|uniref:methylated-DNA--[protein]-cysteine S-methyltransferase n=1 Tax=Solilutibacter silvestris TaxID=1645665 RepID=A0A2K1Q0V4_9GAMM|nr:bifunctional DNA-binding transcriptional regulator/O6-methylguanine-DNA methyltransferase Ada [Lysobacter silvestris]PNS08679.1 ogt: methylated-DNA-[protein]-cysteine S-methyltransferase [Lysobacter silvestris]